jgi:glycosyltransferase involved in cell wall biosynthesis
MSEHKDLRIAYLAAGAAGMYCGSCLRDNRLAATLIEQGRDVVLMPLYTPLKTDERDVSVSPVHYGGLNVYLLQQWGLFRRAPKWLGRMLDRPAILNFLSRWSSSVDAKSLGPLTVSVLRGEDGAQQSELNKLIDALMTIKPDLIHLPTLPFIGVARKLKAALGVPILCTLSGEDVFLDELPEPHRAEAFRLIAKEASHVDAFVSTTKYYARHCVEHFGLHSEKVHVVPMGIRVEDFDTASKSHRDAPFTIGYLARICPEKGLADLCEAFVLLRRAGRDCRLRIAGYVAASQKKFLEGLRDYLRQPATWGHFEIVGEVSRQEKIDFLRTLDLFSVPAVYREAKGLYVLEAMASGVPVIEPRHGSFPELVESTGGGLLYDPKLGPRGLADSLARLMDQPDERRTLGEAGRNAVRRLHTDKVMADETWKLYEHTWQSRHE